MTIEKTRLVSPERVWVLICSMCSEKWCNTWEPERRVAWLVGAEWAEMDMEEWAWVEDWVLVEEFQANLAIQMVLDKTTKDSSKDYKISFKYFILDLVFLPLVSYLDRWFSIWSKQ